MKASVITLGFLALALTHCSGDRGLFVGDEKGGRSGDGGDGETGGNGASGGDNGGTSGASAGTGGDVSAGGDVSVGGNGAQGGGGGTSGDAGTGGDPNAGRAGSDNGGLGGDVSAGGDFSVGGGGALGGTSGDAGTAGDPSRGGTAAGGQAGTNGGGSGGSTNVDCAALSREYLERLAAAQECTLTAMPSDATQCSLPMPDDLICGCPTFVNPTRESDVRRMNEIIDLAKDCSRVCPAIACPAVTKGVCSGDTSIIPARGRCRGAR